MLSYLFGFIGTVSPPPGVEKYGGIGGLSIFLGNILKTLIVIAGLYAVFNFVLAGYAYMSAGGDPKKIADAGAKITQTIIGLIVAAGAVTIAAIIGALLFRDFNALLQLKVFGP